MRFNFLLRKKKPLTNYEGEQAWRLSPEMELYTAAVTAGLNNTFYEKADTRIDRLRTLVTGTDAEFVARLAVYTRTRMHLRSVPLVLAVELARKHTGDSLVRRTVTKVVCRADEITELLAYYQAANPREGEGKRQLSELSKQVQKGLAGAFNKFDEYQFAKYDTRGAVKLRDALFLVRPAPANDAQQAIFNKIAGQTLSTPYTWETELSALGQRKFATANEKKKGVKAKWEELVASGKLGYMALLRNLCNILRADVSPDCICRVCNTIADPQAVAASKQLPFRFLAAYREVAAIKSRYTGGLLVALENATVASADVIRGFDKKTRVLIACDVSGSMYQPVSARSKIKLFDIGLVMGMILQSKCSSVSTGIFGTNWKRVAMPRTSILANVQDFYRRQGEVGLATNGYKVIDDLLARRERMDKVMLFTDCQLWNSGPAINSLSKSWKRYKIMFPGSKLYVFDLAGYGRAPISIERDDVTLIAGWSDKIFDVLAAIENGKNVLDEIKEMKL